MLKESPIILQTLQARTALEDLILELVYRAKKGDYK